MTTVEQVDYVEWDTFLDRDFVWRQGEHVSLIGPTGGGKTTLAKEILQFRQYVAILVTKKRDPSLEKMAKGRGAEYKKVRKWPPEFGQHRVLVWPRLESQSDVAEQHRVFRETVEAIFRTGGWCVYFDELRYLTAHPLKLQNEIELLWQQGRSLGVSVVASTQRPAHVSLMLYDQATHLFFWRDNDEANLKRIGGIGYLSSRLIRDTVASLREHEVLYINSRTGRMLVTKANIRK